MSKEATDMKKPTIVTSKINKERLIRAIKSACLQDDEFFDAVAEAYATALTPQEQRDFLGDDE